MIIDVHNHYYPPEYLDALTRLNSVIKVDYDGEGNPRVHYPGDYNILVKGHRDIAYRKEVLDKEGVDVQLISLTTPGTHIERPEVARELVRAMDDLRMPGAMLFSNVNGTGLDDRQFWPLYEAANDRDAVLMIHPTYPVGVEAMRDYWLMPLNGFLFDTTLAASKLVFSGVVKRYPRIRWVLGHLGGTIPYLAERLDRGWRAFRDCREHIDEPPTTYLRRHFWYDTVNFSAGPLMLAIQFAGVDHILAGSDYPHQIGSIPLMLGAIRGLPISDEDKSAILGGNAARVLAR